MSLTIVFCLTFLKKANYCKNQVIPHKLLTKNTARNFTMNEYYLKCIYRVLFHFIKNRCPKGN